MGRPPAPATLEERFWRHVRKQEDGCWLWVGEKGRNGYGNIRVNSDSRVAHRVGYELLRGPVPVGKQLDHTCRNRMCVNPAHLDVVTSRENTLRGQGPTAINARKEFCLRGHPFDETNTYRKPDGRRRCRICHREAGRRKK